MIGKEVLRRMHQKENCYIHAESNEHATWLMFDQKHKPNKVEKNVFERQAGLVNSGAVAYINFS